MSLDSTASGRSNQTPIALACLIAAPAAHATYRYFSHGYGMHAEGRAGVSIATTDGAFGGANTRATMVMPGDCLKLGIELFSPMRSTERKTTRVRSGYRWHNQERAAPLSAFPKLPTTG
jgi:hypothetical protein